MFMGVLSIILFMSYVNFSEYDLKWFFHNIDAYNPHKVNHMLSIFKFTAVLHWGQSLNTPWF